MPLSQNPVLWSAATGGRWRRALAVAPVLILFSTPNGLESQGPEEQPLVVALESPSLTIGRDDPLHQVRDVALLESSVVILSASFPSVSIFDLSGLAIGKWGAEGDGPGELRNPTHVLVDANGPVVLDMRPGAVRLIRYRWDGTVQQEGRVPHVVIVSDIAGTGGGLVARAREFGEESNTLVTLDMTRDRADTLVTFMSPLKIRIEPESGPRYSSYPPFSPRPAWAMARSGGRDHVVLWEAGNRASTLRLYALEDASRITTWLLPDWPKTRVTDRDLEYWLETAFPRDFFGRSDDPLRDVRAEARRIFDRPEFFPDVLELRSDPKAGVWVKKTPASQGELWVLTEDGHICGAFQLPEGREVLTFGVRHVAAKAVTQEFGEELVELYDRRVVQCEEAGI